MASGNRAYSCSVSKGMSFERETKDSASTSSYTSLAANFPLSEFVICTGVTSHRPDHEAGTQCHVEVQTEMVTGINVTHIHIQQQLLTREQIIIQQRSHMDKLQSTREKNDQLEQIIIQQQSRIDALQSKNEQIIQQQSRTDDKNKHLEQMLNQLLSRFNDLEAIVFPPLEYLQNLNTIRNSEPRSPSCELSSPDPPYLTLVDLNPIDD